jgi:hypothetical protein
VPDLVTIWNLALAHVGEGTVVSDPDEQTTVARVCRRAWEQARDSTLAEHPWHFARRLRTLVAYDPAPEDWAYAYLLPPDVITILAVNPTWLDVWTTAPATYWWTDTQGAIYSGGPALAALLPRIRWQLGGATDEDGLDTPLLLSETTLASMTYTRRVESPATYPPLFVDAVAWKLAFEISLPLSRSENIRSLAWSAYQAALAKAAALDARQRRDSAMPDAEATLERGW